MAPEDTPRSTLRRALPFAWLALSAAWAGVILITDRVAWPLALWIATTVGPLTALDRRSRRTTSTDPNGGGRSADVAVSDAVETDRHERCGRGEQHDQG
jgi:hypothetical protein